MVGMFHLKIFIPKSLVKTIRLEQDQTHNIYIVFIFLI